LEWFQDLLVFDYEKIDTLKPLLRKNPIQWIQIYDMLSTSSMLGE